MATSSHRPEMVGGAGRGLSTFADCLAAAAFAGFAILGLRATT